MLGFIKNLIAGVLNFFIGLFGGKKSGYYLELDEAAEVTKDAAKQAVSKAKDAVESVASSAKKATEPAVSKAASKNGTKNGTKDAQSAPQAQPAKVELVQTANGVKPQPAQVEKAKAAIQQQPAETTFAPKYLAVPSSTNGRRRPGANMSSYIDMARQVKTPG